METGNLLDRTKQFALRVMKVVEVLPKSPSGRAVADQLVRSGMSVAANYRAARRARSKAEFLAKLGIVEEEADESCFWLEIITESGMLPARRIEPLLNEAGELVAIFVRAKQSARRD